MKATAGTAIGAWTAAASAMKSTPFTNTIEVGTEAVRSAWSGLHAVADAVRLAQVLASGATPVPARMTRRAEDGFVTATALANRLVRDGLPFRTAHHAVGAAVRRAVERGQPAIACLELPDGATVDLADDLPLSTVVTALDRGGGPGAFDDGFTPACQAWAEHRSWLRDQRDRLRRADQELSDAVSRVVRPAPQSSDEGGGQAGSPAHRGPKRASG
ncbi:MAG: hypothetical protein ACRDRU_06050 [Pseudonocardiaceae bacterium]